MIEDQGAPASDADLIARVTRPRMCCRKSLWSLLRCSLAGGMTASPRGTRAEPGHNVRQKAGLNRGILNTA